MESTSANTSVPSPKNPFLKNLKNPFVGLRPFEPTENLLFFGRDKQITELVDKLRSFHFMAVVGNSGCGKSSLIRAGLIPNLKRGFLQQQYDSWQFAIMRPGNDPLYYLSDSILKSNLSVHKNEDDTYSQHKAAIEFKKEIIGGGSTVVFKRIEEISKSSGEQSNYFILVDQFEELFDEEIKYRPDKDDKPAVKYKVEDNQINFINILLDLAKQTHLPIYIVITMRSDFLGHCNQFFGLPEVMNQGQYLVPRLDREQRRAAIEGPIYLFKARINNVLLNKLLDDSDATVDELPVLQHALMRTWVGWKKQTVFDKDQPDEEISLANYEAAGGMEKALSNHANEIYDTLVIKTNDLAVDAKKLEKNQEIAEVIFKSLTKIDEKGRRIRRPQDFLVLDELCASLVGSTTDDLKYVINAFREEGNAFLSPYKVGLYDDTEIDISHESLIRKWDKLNEIGNDKGWISEERDSANKYIWLLDAVKENREKLQQFDLQAVEKWKEENKTSEKWAHRYGGEYNAVSKYITDSKQKLDNSNQKAKRRLWTSRILIGALAISILAMTFILANEQVLQQKTQVLQAQDRANKAISQAQIAKAQTEKEHAQKLAAQSQAAASNAKIKIEKALAQAKINEIKLTEIKLKENFQRRIDAAIYTDSLRKNEALRKYEKNENLKLRKQIATNEVYKAYFYKSSVLSDSEKNDIVKTLFKDTLETPQSTLAEFVDTNLLNNINVAVEAKHLININPKEAVSMAKLSWQKSKNPIIEHILFEIFNRYIFCISGIDFSGSIGFLPKLFFSNKNQFLLHSNDSFSNDYSSFISGNYQNDTLSFSADTGLNNMNNIMFWSYSGNNLIVLKRDGQVVEKKSDNLFYKLGLIKNISTYNHYFINPNGNTLAGIDSKGQINLWSLNPFKENPTIIKTNYKNGYIDKIEFSDDDNYMLVFHTNQVDIINVLTQETNKLKSKNYSYFGFFNYAGFAPNNNYVIASNTDTVIGIYNSSGNLLSDYRKLPLISNSTAQYTYLNLSPDWKKMIGICGDDIILFETKNRDSLFKFLSSSIKTSEQLTWKKLAGMDNVLQAKFVDENRILTIDKENYVGLWKIHPDYNDLNEAFANTVFESTSTSVFNRNKPKVLFYQNQAINSEKIIKSQHLTDSATQMGLLSNIYWNLSWYQILIQDFHNATISAKRGFELYPKNAGIITNLALSYLLDNQLEKAEDLYLRYKDKSYTNAASSRKFIDAFNDDISEMVNDKLISANDERIIKILQLLNK